MSKKKVDLVKKFAEKIEELAEDIEKGKKKSPGSMFAKSK